MGVRIILDSTANFRKELKDKFTIVPLSVNFGTESYLDGVEIDTDTFYRKLVTSDVMPTTSQPTPAAFAQAFEEAVNAGDDVVVITISSKLSGTYQSATIAAADFEGKVFVVDSLNATLGERLLGEYALRLSKEGMSAKEANNNFRQGNIEVNDVPLELNAGLNLTRFETKIMKENLNG